MAARAWLYDVATNLVRKHVRAERTRLRHLTPGEPDVVDDPQGRVADIVAAQLGPLVAELRPEERDVLLLAAWGDLSLAEIATATSWTGWSTPVSTRSWPTSRR